MLTDLVQPMPDRLIGEPANPVSIFFPDEERTTRSREEINQPAYGFNNQTQGNDFNFINNNNQIFNNENPYVPPPIKENILKKIKQN